MSKLSKKSIGLIRTTALMSSVMYFAPAVARAADADAAAPDKIGEIVVTAQKRSERLENVPMAVTVATQKTLQQAGITEMHDLDQITPGVQIGYTGILTQPAIRGVTTLTSGEGYENNVAVYIDGFYQPDTGALNMGLTNLQSIEIYKGPQGTLYGRNATGGAIIINTLNPSDHLTANAEVSYQRYNDVRAAVYLSGPISDRIRVSLAGSFRNSDGYYRAIDPNGSGGTVGNAAPVRQRAVEAKVEAELTHSLTATIGYNYMNNADPTTALFPNQGYAPSYLPAEPEAARLPFRASSNVQTVAQAISNDATLKLVQNTPLGDITSRTGYTTRKDEEAYDFDGTYLDIIKIFAHFKEYTFQQMLDYSIDKIDRLKMTIGASYYDDVVHNNGSQTYYAGSILDTQYVRLKDESAAIYADATYQLNQKLFLNIGGRYTHDKKFVDYVDISGAGGTTYLVPPGSEHTAFNNFVPRGTLRYEIQPHTSVYASISQGWRSGGYNPTPPPGAPFKPEKITSAEVGFKTAQSIFRFDASAFYYWYTDLQVGVTQTNPVNGGLINVVSNAPSARIYGLDLDGSLTPLTGLTLSAGLSLLHAHYKDFPGITGIGIDPSSNTNIQQVQDWSGLQMTRAPNVSGNAGFNYETGLAAGKLQVSGNVSFTSSYAQSNPSVYGAGAMANAERYRTGPYALVNGQIGWTEPSGHVTFSVFTTNLTNARYYINYGGTSIFGDFGTFNEPRSVGGKIRFSY